MLGYNGRGYVEQCLDSVLDQDFGSPYEVLFVDNASNDGTAEAAERFDGVRVERMPANLGYCGGNNAGFGLAQAPLVVFLNQDTVVHRCWLRELVAAVESDDAIKAAHANVVHPWNAEYEAKERIAAIGAVYAPELSRLGFVDYRSLVTDAPVVDTLSLSGVSVIIKRDIVEDIGGYVFDPDMFAYGEDVDLALRLRGRGHQVVVATRAVVYHDHTLDDKPSLRSFAKAVRIIRNRLLAFWKNSDGPEAAALSAIVLAGAPFNSGQFGLPAWKKALYFALLLPPTLVAAVRAGMEAPKYAARRRVVLANRRLKRGWLLRALLSDRSRLMTPS
ncbi:MAG TPA: glycosyltransferase family 2 protein [Polyangia bacterium]